MCDFHLKGNCFHPERVQTGLIANKCNFESCNDCTNKEWQQNKIQSLNKYHQDIISLINNELPTFKITSEQTNKIFNLTKVFG